MRNQAPARWIALAALALAACTARHQQGDECVFNGDCADPLVCAARRCRLACRTDRDCRNNTVCRPSGELGVRVCLPPEAPWSCAAHEDCDAPDICGPTHQCQRPCRVDYDCRFVSFGARCAEGVCEAADAATPDDAAADAKAPADAEAPDAADASRDAVDLTDAAIDDGATADGAALDASADRDDAGDAATPMDATGGADATADATADARADVGTPPTYSFLDVPAYDASPPARLRAVFARQRVCAIRDDGRTFCWGPNPANSLGVAPDAGAVVSAPTEVPALAGAVEVALGSDCTCARMGDGTVRCAGRGGAGQLGNGSTADSASFVAVPGITGATALRAGDEHFCALLGDATVRCWGFNLFGQLGDGSTGNRATPVSPRGLTGVADLALGQGHSCARLTDGTVRCWGLNNSGQLGVGSAAATVITPTAVTGLTGVTYLSVAYDSSCALRSDGSAWCWGANTHQMLGDGTFTARNAPVRVMNAPPDARSVEVSALATCFVHGAARNVSCFGMEPLGDGPASGAGSSGSLRMARGVADVERLSARSHNIGQALYTAQRPDGTALLWGNVGEGVFGPRAVSIGVPIAVEIP